MLLLLAAAASAHVAKCEGVPIRRMIARYAELQRHQDVDGIASLFGIDGVIDNPGAQPVVGSVAVHKLLAGFHGFVVTSNALMVDRVVPEAGGWQVTGHFHQTGRTPEPKDYDVAGSFDSTWICSAHGWRVRRMATGK